MLDRKVAGISLGRQLTLERFLQCLICQEPLHRRTSKYCSRKCAGKALGQSNIGHHHSEESKVERAKVMKGRWKDPLQRETFLANLRSQWDSPIRKMALKEVVIQKWANPELRKSLSESMKVIWKDSELRKQAGEVSRRYWGEPENKEKHNQQYWTEPTNREKRSLQAIKQMQEDPDQLFVARSHNKNKSTSIEIMAQESLAQRGIPFITNIQIGNIANADIVLLDKKVALFMDGCYWHECKQCGHSTAIGGKVQERDIRQTKQLIEQGWQVLRFWEHDINQNHDIVAEALRKIVMEVVTR